MKRYAAAVINTENGYFKSFKYSLSVIFLELAISYDYWEVLLRWQRIKE